MDRLKLRGRIIEKYGTIGTFCQEIGISPNTATNVLGGKTTPTSKKLPKWCAALNIAPDEIGDFFYPETWENYGNR